MLKIFTLLSITTPIFCQDGLEPDVTFGDQNDRFDINDMLQQSKTYFNDEPNYDRSRIDNSMRADDTILEAIPERRQNYANRHKTDPSNDESHAFHKTLKEYEQNNKETRRNSPTISTNVGKNGDTLQEAIPTRRQNYAYHDKMEADKDEARADYEANLKAYALNSSKTRRNEPKILSRLNHDTLQEAIPKRRQNYTDRNRIDFGNEKAKKKISFQNIIEDLHAGKIYGSRRDGAKPLIDPDLEILMHYAVPINAKFHGFLTAPLVN